MNNRYLLDTQVLIWWMEGNRRLGSDISKLILDSRSNIFVSVATIWEMVIKVGVGKLKLPKNWQRTIERPGFLILAIGIDHVFELEKLPQVHKDPFDRMLVAQARVENLTLVTSDPKIKKYNVLVWD